MKQRSLRINAVLNLIKTLMGVLFPLITFPYASRVLLPEGIGRVNFAVSVISYFGLFASLGINSYGVREAAKIRDSRENLSKFAKEIFTINMVSTAAAYSMLAVSILFVPKLQEYRTLLIVCSATILFTTLGMEWLYTAVEDFSYITIRSIIFQVVSLALLFLFVRTSEDIVRYAAISVVSSAGSNIFNFIHAKKYISLGKTRIKPGSLKKHIRPVMILFAMVVTSSIYTILDTGMLGFMTSDYQVGIYTAATKINRIVLNLVVSIGAVLLPRLSYYCGMNDRKKFLELAYKSLDLLMLLAVPAAIGLSVLAEPVILTLSGRQYLDAVPVMRIINPIIVVVGMSNFIGVQIFMPLGKEKWTLYSDIAGACINIALNALLIPPLGALGAAAASVCAELTVTGTQLYLVRNYLSLGTVFGKIVKYFAMSLIMGVAASAAARVFCFSTLASLIFGIFAGGSVYLAELLVTKNQWVNLIWNEVKGRLHGNQK